MTHIATEIMFRPWAVILSISFMPCFPFSNQEATLVVAAQDGTFCQVGISSGKILWSFTSGAPIYDSPQSVNLEDDVMHPLQ